MSFFSKYPKVNYDLFSDGSIFELTDISRGIILNSNQIGDDSTPYTYYTIDNGDRPDIVSHKLYGDSSYYWTFFVLNNSLRDGYTSSWPLSYHNFIKMIERDYSKFSSISILPTVEPEKDLNGTGTLDISFIPLTSQYTPYLKFVSDDDVYASTFVRYDASRNHCIISDIYKINKSTGVDTRIYTIPRENFVENESMAYKITWDDTIREHGLSSVDAENKNIALKAEWIDIIYSNIKKYDPIGIAEHIAGTTTKKSYVTSKTLRVAKKEFRWSDYANAPYQYLSPDDNILSSYDILTNPNIINPQLTSFYDYETSLNDSKRTIKTMRPEFIIDFSDKYFEELNDKLL